MLSTFVPPRGLLVEGAANSLPLWTDFWQRHDPLWQAEYDALQNRMLWEEQVLMDAIDDAVKSFLSEACGSTCGCVSKKSNTVNDALPRPPQ
eukprot:6643899-Karenia_brevis.AAC.1